MMKMSNALFKEAERRAVEEVENRLRPVLAEFGLLPLGIVEKKQLFQFCFDEDRLNLDGEILSIPVVVEMKMKAADRILGQRLCPKDLLKLGKQVSGLSFVLIIEGVVRQDDIIHLASELRKVESAGGGSNATRQRIERGIAGL